MRKSESQLLLDEIAKRDEVIAENCGRLKIDMREYLTDVFTRPQALKTGEAVSLTPTAWLNARNGKAEQRIA